MRSFPSNVALVLALPLFSGCVQHLINTAMLQGNIVETQCGALKNIMPAESPSSSSENDITATSKLLEKRLDAVIADQCADMKVCNNADSKSPFKDMVDQFVGTRKALRNLNQDATQIDGDLKALNTAIESSASKSLKDAEKNCADDKLRSDCALALVAIDEKDLNKLDADLDAIQTEAQELQPSSGSDGYLSEEDIYRLQGSLQASRNAVKELINKDKNAIIDHYFQVAITFDEADRLLSLMQRQLTPVDHFLDTINGKTYGLLTIGYVVTQGKFQGYANEAYIAAKKSGLSTIFARPSSQLAFARAACVRIESTQQSQYSWIMPYVLTAFVDGMDKPDRTKLSSTDLAEAVKAKDAAIKNEAQRISSASSLKPINDLNVLYACQHSAREIRGQSAELGGALTNGEIDAATSQACGNTAYNLGLNRPDAPDLPHVDHLLVKATIDTNARNAFVNAMKESTSNDANARNAVVNTVIESTANNENAETEICRSLEMQDTAIRCTSKHSGNVKIRIDHAFATGDWSNQRVRDALRTIAESPFANGLYKADVEGYASEAAEPCAKLRRSNMESLSAIQCTDGTSDRGDLDNPGCSGVPHAVGSGNLVLSDARAAWAGKELRQAGFPGNEVRTCPKGRTGADLGNSYLDREVVIIFTRLSPATN